MGGGQIIVWLRHSSAHRGCNIISDYTRWYQPIKCFDTKWCAKQQSDHKKHEYMLEYHVSLAERAWARSAWAQTSRVVPQRARSALVEDPGGILIINPCSLCHYTWGNSRRIYWKMTLFRGLYNTHFVLTKRLGHCYMLCLECTCEQAEVSIWDTSVPKPTRELLTKRIWTYITFWKLLPASMGKWSGKYMLKEMGGDLGVIP